MRRNHAITTAAFALAAAAALPTLALASGGGHTNPQQEARIERLIEQAIQGDSDADRQEQARIDRLVQQALERAAAPLAGQPTGQPAGMGRDARASVLAQGRAGAIAR